MTDLKTVELDSLIGEHVLDGVDLTTERVKPYGDHYEDANVIRFRLDGLVHTAIEDPSDGYRSSLDKLFVEDCPITNTFAPVRVVAKKKSDDTYAKNDTLELVDVVTGKVVLEVGTDNHDDYYPSFVGVFWPQHMSINQS